MCNKSRLKSTVNLFFYNLKVMSDLKKPEDHETCIQIYVIIDIIERLIERVANGEFFYFLYIF